jgi:HipA-like C-terminal domain
MQHVYPIYRVALAQPELTEQVGSKPKFWFRRSDDEQRWLFKFSRQGTGEDWAEKIAAELAAVLEIPAATVELADFNGHRGSISRSFVLSSEGWDLVHGDELLAGCVHGYRREQVFHQTEHTLENIFKVMSKCFSDREQLEAQIEQFVGYLVLDALVGNVDRHHQNWAILRRTRTDGSVEEMLAPSFDHASSLGRNAPAKERERRLAEGSVGAYVLKGRGGIFLTSSDQHGANPLSLVQSVAVAMPGALQFWTRKLSALPQAKINSIIESVPEPVMDEMSKRFTLAFLMFTREQLCSL